MAPRTEADDIVADGVGDTHGLIDSNELKIGGCTGGGVIEQADSVLRKKARDLAALVPCILKEVLGAQLERGAERLVVDRGGFAVVIGAVGGRDPGVLAHGV